MPYGHVHDAAHHRCCCGGSHASLLDVSGMTSASSSNKATRAKQEMYSMYLHVQQSGSVFIAAGEQEIGYIPMYRRACLHVRVQCNTRLTKASISNRTPLVPGPLATHQHEAHESHIGLVSSLVGSGCTTHSVVRSVSRDNGANCEGEGYMHTSKDNPCPFIRD
jgi:hypothetical protein